MNNKEFEFDFDDFDVDDFGTNDPFQDPAEPKKDRNPVTDVAKGAFTGFKETTTDPSFYTNVLRKALPEGYGAAFNVASDVTDKGIGLYNQVTEDLRPAIIDLKRIGRRAKNMVNGVLPDSVSQKLDEILKEEERNSAELSKEQIREQSIAGELAPIFKAQAEEKKEEVTNDLMYKVVESKRHTSNMEMTVGIRNELTKLNAYQDNVTMQWQRKTLELKLRHFFVAKDHYELFKATQEETLGHFRNISKNTALPEAVKVKDSELALQLTKEKLIGKAQDKFAPMARDFLNKFSGNLGKRLGEKISEFKDAVSTASFAGDMLDGIDLEELGISKSELGGQMAGETATRAFGEWLGKKAAPWLNKNGKVKTLSNKLLYGSENYHNIAREWLENKTFTSETGNMLQEAALDALRNRRESRVGYDQISNSMEHASLNNMTLKSINEVIPGWLSKLYHATVNKKEGTETFDHVTNTFMDTDDLAKRIAKEAISDSEIEQLRDINKNLMSNLTDGSVDDISDKIEEMFIHFARSDVAFDPKKLMEGDYLTQSKLNMVDYDRFAEAVYTKMGLQTDGTLGNDNIAGSAIQVEANRDLRRLRETMPNAYETANIYANTANREAVRRSGLTENINGDDHVRDSYLFERYRNNDPTPTPWNPPTDPDDVTPTPTDDGSPPWNPPVVDNPIITQSENTELVEQISELVKELQNKASVDIDIDYDRLYEIESTFSSQKQNLKQIEILSEIKELLIELPDYFGSQSEGSEGKIRSGIRRGKDYLKGKYQKGKDFTKGIFSSPIAFGKKALGMITNPFTKPIGFATKMLGKAKDKLLGLKNIDLYTYDNPLKPAIDKAKLEAGEYYDVVTGKVITKISDIKNAIKDKDGNWAIRPDQLAKGLFDEAGKKVNLGKIKEWIKKPLTLLNPKKLFGLTNMFGRLSDRLNRLKDVYVEGETEPRLTVDGIKQGKYYNTKGKVVKTLKDITTPIYEGKRCKIKSDELDKLVDIDGNKLRGFVSNMLGKATGLIGKGFSTIKNLGKKAFGLLKGGSDKASEVMSGSLGWLASKIPGFGGGKGGGISIGGGSIQNRIYSLLLKYFAFKGLDVKEELDAQSKVGGSIFSGLGEKLSSAKNKIKGLFDTKEKRDKLKEKIKDKASGLADRAMNTKEDLKTKSSDLYEKAKKKKDDLKAKGKDKLDEFSKTSRGEKLLAAKERIKNKYNEKKESFKEKASDFGSKMNGYMTTLFGKFKKFRSDEERSKRPSFMDRLKSERDGLKDRAGSFVNIMKERAEKRKAKKEEKKKAKGDSKSSKSGFFGSVLSMLGGSLGWLGKIAGGIMGLGGILSTILGVVGGAGLMGKALDFIGLGGKQAGKSWTRRLLSLGGRALMGAGSLALRAAPAAIAAAPAIAGGIATAVTATAAVIFSPVVLTGAAIAGVTYLGYKWYTESMDLFTELRMAQYGVKDLEFSECERIGKFEELLKPYVAINDEQASIQGKIPFEQIPEIFDFNIKDKRSVIAFNDWFTKRFKPVFLRQKYLLQKMGKTNDLMVLKNSIPDDQKIKFAKASIIRQEPSPYDTTACPFGDEDLTMEHGMKVIESKLKEIEDEYKVNRPTATPKGSVSAARRKANQMNSLNKDKRGVMTLENAYTNSAANIVAGTGGGKAGAASNVNYLTGEVEDAQEKVVDYVTVRGGSTTNKTKVQPERPIPDYVPNASPGYTKRHNPTYSKIVEEKIASMGDIDTTAIYRPTAMTVGEIGLMIMSVAKVAAMEPEPILELAKHATNFRLNIRIGSRAGLYLMDAAMFRQLMDKHGVRYGVKNPDIKDPTDATIAVAEFLKIAISKLRAALGREPTAAENLSAMIYGVDETIKLINSPDDVDVKTVIVSRTSEDTKRLAEVSNKEDFFSGLSERLNKVTDNVVPITSSPKARQQSSYVQQRTEEVTVADESSSRTPADIDYRKAVEQRTVERAKERAQQQRIRVKEQHMAESSQNSNRSVQELVKINAVLDESRTLHREHLTVLKEILKNSRGVQPAATAVNQPQPTTQPQETVASNKQPPPDSMMDESKINVRRTI